MDDTGMGFEEFRLECRKAQGVGIPLLGRRGYGEPLWCSVDAEVLKKLIDVVGRDGGFILKGELPKEARPENINALIRTAKTYGVYTA